MSVGRNLHAINKGLATIVTVAGSLALLFMMGVVVYDVIARSINPAWRLFGALDLVEFSLDWMICLSIAAAIFAGQIISVDLVDAMDRRGVLQWTGLAALLVILSVMGWQTIRPALNVLNWGEITFDLGLPKFWYWIAIWTGLGLSVIGLILQLARKVWRS